MKLSSVSITTLLFYLGALLLSSAACTDPARGQDTPPQTDPAAQSVERAVQEARAARDAADAAQAAAQDAAAAAPSQGDRATPAQGDEAPPVQRAVQAANAAQDAARAARAAQAARAAAQAAQVAAQTTQSAQAVRNAQVAQAAAQAEQASAFAQEPLGQNKVQGIRDFLAAQVGKTADKCSNVVGTPPQPTAQQYGQYYEPFGSTFDVAASFGDTGSGGIPSAQNTIQTEALGEIQFESEHFFYDYLKCVDRKPTLSFGGTVGLRPVVVLENLSSTTETIANPNNRPMFQDAFGWTLGPKLNVATSHMSQFAVFANLGENYLISQVSSFKQGDNTVTATPVSNGVGQSAIYWESGAEWRYFNTDIATAYLDKTDVLDPPFSISVGYKNDSRFNGSGALLGFDNPEARLFFRFSVGLNKIGNWSGTQALPGKGYTFKFGVDYEKPIGDSRLPTSTRYYVSANIDVMKVFQPSNSQPAP